MQKYLCILQLWPSGATEILKEIFIYQTYICPIKNLEEPLQKIISSQLQKYSAEPGQMTEKLQNVLTLIEENGIAATGKY